MPNDCENTVVVKGSDEDMKAFYAKFTNENQFSFQDFVPRPPEQEANWYNWNVDNWGTKWDIYQDAFRAMRGVYIYDMSFLTAWSPPLPFLDALAKQFPGLVVSISFFEPGMQFLGYYKWKNGELQEKVYHEYTNDEELKKLFNTHTTNQRAAWWCPDEDEEES